MPAGEAAGQAGVACNMIHDSRAASREHGVANSQGPQPALPSPLAAAPPEAQSGSISAAACPAQSCIQACSIPWHAAGFPEVAAAQWAVHPQAGAQPPEEWWVPALCAPTALRCRRPTSASLHARDLVPDAHALLACTQSRARCTCSACIHAHAHTSAPPRVFPCPTTHEGSGQKTAAEQPPATGPACRLP